MAKGQRSHAEAAQLRKQISDLLALGYENKEIERALQINEWTMLGQLRQLRQEHGIETTRRLVLFLAHAPGHWPKKSRLLRPSGYFVHSDSVTDGSMEGVVHV